ncbi:MAG: FHA domain-containing protein [bacterium]
MSAAFAAAPVPGADPTASPPGFPAETFRANLYLHHPDGRVEWYALLPVSFEGGRSLVVGRAADSAVWIDDEAVSGRHARVFARGAALYIEDLGSTNGTWLDGHPIQREVLADGVTLIIGHCEVRFLYSLRESPVRVGFTFDRGPLAGRRVLSEAGSATVGGRGCDVELPGELTRRHLRIDAYAPDRVYAVPLDGGHPVRSGGAALTGITPLEAGARLEIGAHRFAVTAVDAARLPAAESQPRGDAALVEARLMGHDPRAYNRRTIMDLSPLGAMVAKVLAGEAPMPPSAVRPPAQRPGPRPTLMVDANEARQQLARRTGRVAAITPPRRARRGWAIAGIAAVVVVGVAAAVPVPREVALAGRIETGPVVTASAPVRGRLVRRLAPVGGLVRAGAPLVQLADGAIEEEIDRLSTRIGELEIYARPGRPTASAVEAADAALAEATRAVEATDAAFAAGEERFEAARAARVKQAEAAGRQAATRARRADRRAGPDPRAAAAELGKLVQRRQSLGGRLRVTVAAPVTGRVETAPTEPPGAPVEVGRPLYTLGPTDVLVARFDPVAPELAALVDAGGRQARLRLGAQQLDAPLAAEAAGHYTARFPGAEPPPLGEAVTAAVDAPPTNGFGWLRARLARSR